MTKFIDDDSLDADLDKIATCTNMTVCSAAPANYAGIAAVALASTTLTAGDGNGDYTIADDTSGRKLTVAAQSGVEISATGTPTHLALDDGTTLRCVTEATTVGELSEGNTVNIPSFKVNSKDPV